MNAQVRRSNLDGSFKRLGGLDQISGFQEHGSELEMAFEILRTDRNGGASYLNGSWHFAPPLENSAETEMVDRSLWMQLHRTPSSEFCSLKIVVLLP